MAVGYPYKTKHLLFSPLSFLLSFFFFPVNIRQPKPPLSHLCKRFFTSSHQFKSPLHNSTSNSASSLHLSSLSTEPYSIAMALNDSVKTSSLHLGQKNHCHAIKIGLSLSDTYVSTGILNVYCKCRRIQDAQKFFDEMPQRNVVAWNAMIHGYSQSRSAVAALEMFRKMLLSTVSPSEFSMSSALVACSMLPAVQIGAAVHSIGVRRGLCSNVVAGTALVDMYVKCFNVDGAQRAFHEMEDRNVVTWTSLINGYGELQRTDEVMNLAKEMTSNAGIRLNAVTYATILSSLRKNDDLVHGSQIHSLVIQEGFQFHPYVLSALTMMYSRCGTSENLIKIAPVNLTGDRVSCNSMITGLVQMENNSEALVKFVEMRREGVLIDHFTLASILKAIGNLSAVEEGRQIHALVLKMGFASTTCVSNGLISTYARCGVVGDAGHVFSSMEEPDLVSWNSLLSGYAQQGHGRKAVELFEEMRRLKVKPDGTTFLCVLSACSHAGFVNKGLEYFALMRQMSSADPHAKPEMEHYACMVDLFGRAGFLYEAESFVNSMPLKPGPSIYRSLISACKVHGDMEVAMRAAEGLVQLRPNDSATYALLSNVFAGQSCWSSAAMVHQMMIERGIKKMPGWSRIEG